MLKHGKNKDYTEEIRTMRDDRDDINEKLKKLKKENENFEAGIRKLHYPEDVLDDIRKSRTKDEAAEKAQMARLKMEEEARAKAIQDDVVAENKREMEIYYQLL